MFCNRVRTGALLSLICIAVSMAAGQSSTSSSNPVFPTLINFSGSLNGLDGKPLTSLAGVTFLLYAESQGGAPLWMETQNVQPNRTGHYTVTLGSTTSQGLPTSVFASGEARWLGVQVQGQEEQPRVMLLAVPYALKAADAQTVGGLPPSAFVLAAPAAVNSISSAGTPNHALAPSTALPASSNVTTTGGTANAIPLFTTATNIQNSILTQTGATAVNVAGKLNLPATGAATATAGKNSRPEDFVASAFNSSSAAAVAQTFQLQAEAAGNNTAAPFGTLNLLYGSGTAVPAETGLKISNKGLLTFAAGQTFPGTGQGTITDVTAGTDLTGGGTTGSVTLKLDTTKVPQLAASNNFTGTQTITNGILNLSPTTGSEVGAVYIGGVPFLHGYAGGKKNVFVGGAGNFSTTGSFTAAVGYQALFSQSSGTGNTAVGDVALYSTSSGSNNTAVGNGALFGNTSGTLNTAIGASSGPSLGSSALTNTTAVGAGATVSQSNSLVLGQTTTSSPGTAFVNVGIGTASPRSIFEVAQSVTGALGPVMTLTNPAGQSGAAAAIDFNTSTPAGGPSYVPNSEIRAVDAGGYTDNLDFFSNKPGAINNGYQLNMEIGASGQVVVGGQQPVSTAQLVVFQAENNTAGIQAYGATIPTGTGAGDGGDAINGNGGNSTGANVAGSGGVFIGGNNYENGIAGEGIVAAAGIGGATAGLAGFFDGDVGVLGNVSKSGGSFKIDHPLNPANKYLYHSFVESPDMMNIYNGNVVTDANGDAVVPLPEWFETLNRDFRYQLTVVGQFAQAIVANKVANNQFSIKTDKPNLEVSWQVTGIRQDPWANAHRIPVEEQKDARERGHYIHPELYGAPEEASIAWARHPETMKRMKEARQTKSRTLQTNAPQQPSPTKP